jgi:hypothetical protein
MAPFAGGPRAEPLSEPATDYLLCARRTARRRRRTHVRVLISQFNGGPVGLTTLAAAVNESPVTLEEAHEPFLMRAGLLKRTPRGRAATAGVYRHLGLPVPAALAAGDEPDLERANVGARVNRPLRRRSEQSCPLRARSAPISTSPGLSRHRVIAWKISESREVMLGQACLAVWGVRGSSPLSSTAYDEGL